MLNIEEFADRNELFDGHYALIRPLSVDGATADVWLALDTNTLADNANVEEIIRMDEEDIGKEGLLVAIKVYRPQNALDIEGEQRFRDEYMIVFNCHHTNLIHPTHFSIFMETPYLVLPYCKLGSSESLVGTEFGADDIWKYILDVSSGLAYLHALEPPIIHQDIKPANILLDDTHHYAITDFGISAQRGGVHGGYYDEENSGTLAYMAPERFQEEAEPIPQSDIWAFGATLYEILTGKVPFGEEGGKNQIELDAPLPPVMNVPADIQRLINACLAKNPGDRPSAEQLIEAAKAKQYPIKSRKILYGALIAILLVLIVGVTHFLSKPSEEIVTYQPTMEELYQEALHKMNINDKDSLKVGLAMMDRLSDSDYIPAMYEIAFTYGWYSDSASVKRKNMLGISINDSLLPTSDEYSNKAIDLYTEILKLNDSSYADINADAAYRKACYYVNSNDIYKQDCDKGKDLLICSKKWATLAGDNKLLQKIEAGIASLNNN